VIGCQGTNLKSKRCIPFPVVFQFANSPAQMIALSKRGVKRKGEIDAEALQKHSSGFTWPSGFIRKMC